jgi:hypothetical protein
MRSAYEGYCKEFSAAVETWNELIKTDLPSVNGDLAVRNQAALSAQPLTVPNCKQ